ncbi:MULTISPECIES: M15 family metallopeptidase [unclassified Actinotalea]|uniref:M15 family metallopeptidase n=1 Tax=unclassified Actinotalea TaxID=2638618 RepID=UPI0015F36C74|nr:MULTISPECIES: M15 family metallopeptidase [unclassified Actinotalea]
MSWLAPVPPDAVVPTGLPAVAAPVPVLGADDVVVADDRTPLVPVRPALATFGVYAHLHLPSVPAEPRLRADVVARLRAADRSLPPGWSLCVLDAWRPQALQRELVAFYERAHGGPVTGFVADPDGPVAPPHTTGGTVDLTLAWRGLPLALGTDFDAFTPDAAPTALEVPGADPATRDARRLLAHVMVTAGFVVNEQEWWHWEHGTHQWGRVTGTRTVPYGLTTA